MKFQEVSQRIHQNYSGNTTDPFENGKGKKKIEKESKSNSVPVQILPSDEDMEIIANEIEETQLSDVAEKKSKKKKRKHGDGEDNGVDHERELMKSISLAQKKSKAENDEKNEIITRSSTENATTTTQSSEFEKAKKGKKNKKE